MNLRGEQSTIYIESWTCNNSTVQRYAKQGYPGFLRFAKICLFSIKKRSFSVIRFCMLKHHFNLNGRISPHFQFLKGAFLATDNLFCGVGVTLLQKVIMLTMTQEKLHCKGEPYRFSGQRDYSVHTDRYPVTQD